MNVRCQIVEKIIPEFKINVEKNLTFIPTFIRFCNEYENAKLCIFVEHI